MCSRQVPTGHQKFVDNLSARKDKRLFEQPGPFFLCEWMIAVEPSFKGTTFFLKRQDLLCIDDGSIDLQTVSDDAWIAKQAGTILFAIFRHPCNVKAVIGLA